MHDIEGGGVLAMGKETSIADCSGSPRFDFVRSGDVATHTRNERVARPGGSRIDRSNSGGGMIAPNLQPIALARPAANPTRRTDSTHAMAFAIVAIAAAFVVVIVSLSAIVLRRRPMHLASRHAISARPVASITEPESLPQVVPSIASTASPPVESAAATPAPATRRAPHHARRVPDSAPRVASVDHTAPITTTPARPSCSERCHGDMNCLMQCSLERPSVARR
jgi:hypothetical protein